MATGAKDLNAAGNVCGHESSLRPARPLHVPKLQNTTELLNLNARLAVLVPKPRVNLTRFHGICTEQPIPGKIDSGDSTRKPVRYVLVAAGW